MRERGLGRRRDRCPARPAVKCLPDACLHGRGVEDAGDIEPRSVGSEVPAVKSLHLVEREAREHRLGRKDPAVRMVAVHQLRELLLRRRLRRALPNRQLARHVRLDPGKLGFGKARPRRDVGDEPHGPNAVIGQDVGRNGRPVRTDADTELTAHRRELARERIGGERGRPLFHHVAGQIREPDLIFLFVHVRGLDDEPDGHLRHLAEGHHRDGQTVREREPLRAGDDKVLGRTSGGRRLLLLGPDGTNQCDGDRRGDGQSRDDVSRHSVRPHRAPPFPAAPALPGVIT